MADLTEKEYAKLGRDVRGAKKNNLVIGAFAAELIGESYPLPQSMWGIVFSPFDDEHLGRKFARWCSLYD